MIFGGAARDISLSSGLAAGKGFFVGAGDDSGIMNPFGVFAKISLFTGALATERVANDWWIVYVVILLEEEDAEEANMDEWVSE